MTELGSVDRYTTRVPVTSALHRTSAVVRLLQTWLRTAFEFYWVAEEYEELSRLSDAELHRRGLSRESMARDVIKSATEKADRKSS